MSELSKFINLLIEFEEKIETNLNKKYKTFIRSVLNLYVGQEYQAWPNNPEQIVYCFQTGNVGQIPKGSRNLTILPSSSCLIIQKFFQLKFIDLNGPNLCENYVIEESGVK